MDTQINYNMGRIRSFLFFCVIFFSSCDKNIIEFEETNTPVVIGYLISGLPIENFKVTKSNSLNQTEEGTLPIDDLNISISNSEKVYTLNSIGNGLYDNSNLIIKEGETYDLEFSWNEKIVSSTTYVPLKKKSLISISEVEIPKVTVGSGFNRPQNIGSTDVDITWDNTEGDYYYVTIKNIEENPEYINDNFELNDDTEDDDSNFDFVTPPTNSDFYSFNASQRLDKYGTHQILVYRLNPEYNDLYSSSGNNSLSLVQPTTNIVNGLGIFTGMSCDTLYLEAKKIVLE